VDGVLVIDKPAGPTSHDVVARVRRVLHADRVGHTGTLDPIATGVLPLVVGRATRLARFFSSADKEYEAAIRLGQPTDTDDATGRAQEAPGVAGPMAEEPRPVETVTRVDLDGALRAFIGTYEQTPPAFSAKKIDGVRAYVLARRGRATEPRPVTVTVHHLTLLSFDAGVVRLLVASSAGFYVRSLARDLGRRLGTGAHLAALRRVRSGEFGGDQAVPLDTIEREGLDARRRVTPLHALLPHLPGLVLTEDGTRRAAHGNDVGPADLAAGWTFPAGATAGSVRLLGPAGELVAVAEPAGKPGFLHPAVVVL
jgi:tRNA pseudouridine55 synthase